MNFRWGGLGPVEDMMPTFMLKNKNKKTLNFRCRWLETPYLHGVYSLKPKID
jgi:hypothetical protein